MKERTHILPHSLFFVKLIAIDFRIDFAFFFMSFDNIKINMVCFPSTSLEVFLSPALYGLAFAETSTSTASYFLHAPKLTVEICLCNFFFI